MKSWTLEHGKFWRCNRLFWYRLNQVKLEIVTKQMDGIKIDILGISELKWTGTGHLQPENIKMFYMHINCSSGTQRGQIILDTRAIICHICFLLESFQQNHNYIWGYNRRFWYRLKTFAFRSVECNQPQYPSCHKSVNRFLFFQSELTDRLSGEHHWYSSTHSRPTFCNVCGDLLAGISGKGLSCEGMPQNRLETSSTEHILLLNLNWKEESLALSFKKANEILLGLFYIFVIKTFSHPVYDGVFHNSMTIVCNTIQYDTIQWNMCDAIRR